MSKIQQLQLKLLIKLDEICKKHGLRYYLAYGTCLGAVRHQGFIPWDHDIDVLMPVDDAMKLEQYQDELTPNYFIQSYRTDPTFGNTCMSLADLAHQTNDYKGETFIQQSHVCIDIYLLYDLPPNRFSLLCNIWRSHLHKMLVGGVPKNHGVLVKTAAKIILAVFGRGDRETKIRRIEKKLNYQGDAVEVADYFGEDISFCSVIRYKKEWFAEPTKMEFEGHVFDGPTDPDQYLTKRYGDYMTPPTKTQWDQEPWQELVE